MTNQATYQARSRASGFRKAVRPALPARLMISGPPGAGKTYTALSIATTLATDLGRVKMIDSEPQSGTFTASVTYADMFDFDYLPWAPPYDPRDLTATLDEMAADANPNDVIIVDSLTHWWSGPGGILDIADGRFTNWKDARPIQEALVDRLKTMPCHVIWAARAKVQYAVAEGPDAKGKTKQSIEVIGTAPQTDANLEYEAQVAIMVDRSHTVQVGKSRCSRLAGMTFRPNHEAELADIYMEWLAAGATLVTPQQVAALVGPLDAVEPMAERKRLKTEFVSQFGRPNELLADDFPRALEWVTATVGGPPAPVAAPVSVAEAAVVESGLAKPAPADPTDELVAEAAEFAKAAAEAKAAEIVAQLAAEEEALAASLNGVELAS